MARTSIGKSANKKNDRELKSCSFSGMVRCKKRRKIFIVYVIRKKEQQLLPLSACVTFICIAFIECECDFIVGTL